MADLQDDTPVAVDAAASAPESKGNWFTNGLKAISGGIKNITNSDAMKKIQDGAKAAGHPLGVQNLKDIGAAISPVGAAVVARVVKETDKKGPAQVVGQDANTAWGNAMNGAKARMADLNDAATAGKKNNAPVETRDLSKIPLAQAEVDRLARVEVGRLAATHTAPKADAPTVATAGVAAPASADVRGLDGANPAVVERTLADGGPRIERLGRENIGKVSGAAVDIAHLDTGKHGADPAAASMNKSFAATGAGETHYRMNRSTYEAAYKQINGKANTGVAATHLAELSGGNVNATVADGAQVNTRKVPLGPALGME